MDGLEGHLVFYNMSFNLEALALDVDVCCPLVGFSTTSIYGLLSNKKYWINIFVTSVE
jgi:hypothetical protein